MASIIPVLRNFPASIAQKLLAKADPRFKKYFASALSYGIDADRALSYLSERFGNEASQAYEGGLARKGGAEQLRPDQMVSRSQLRNEAMPGRLLKGAASVGIGAALGGPVGAALGVGEELGQDEEGFKPRSGKEAIVENLAQRKMREPKELSREGLMKQFEEGRPGLGSQSPIQVFARYSPEMGRALTEMIQQGQDGMEAAIAAASDPRFNQIVKAMERDFQAPIDQIVRQLFGRGGQNNQGGSKEGLATSMKQITSLLQQITGQR